MNHASKLLNTCLLALATLSSVAFTASTSCLPAACEPITLFDSTEMKLKIPAQSGEKAYASWSPMLRSLNPALRPSNELRSWPTKAFRVLGTLLIITSLLTITWNILVWGQASFYTTLSPGVWGGVLLFVTGFLAVMVGVKKTPCLVVSTLVLATFAVCANVIILGAGSMEVIVTLSRNDYPIDFIPSQPVASNSSNATTDFDYEDVVSDQERSISDASSMYYDNGRDNGRIFLSFTILIVVTSIVNLILLLALSVCSCRRLCKPTSAIIVYAMPCPALNTNSERPGWPHNPQALLTAPSIPSSA